MGKKLDTRELKDRRGKPTREERKRAAQKEEEE